MSTVRKPNESDADYYRRAWRADHSREALAGFYKHVFEQDLGLHTKDTLIAYLGEPSDIDERWIHYEVAGDTYFISFAYDAESGEITGWTES